MRCIETTSPCLGYAAVGQIKSNMRCIETKMIALAKQASHPIKSNMRCIETPITHIGAAYGINDKE